MFNVGDRVEWSSQAAGIERLKIGEVVELVLPGHRPEARVDSSGCVRDHVSYVVRAVAQGRRYRKSALYWPSVAGLRPHVEREVHFSEQPR